MHLRSLVAARRGPFVIVVVVAALALGACGAAPSAPSVAAPTTPPAGSAFPVTIRHAYGDVTIPSEPHRIVALGSGDLALATELGRTVVGAAPNWDPTRPNLPYLSRQYGPDVLGIGPSETIDVEKVASYRPDLILAVYAVGLDESVYAMLSRIAPVVTYERSLFGSSMEQDARLIGRALGAQGGVERFIAEARADVEQVAQQLPGLAGKTYLYGQARGDVLPMVVGAENPSTAFMRSLGLSVPPGFAGAPADGRLAPGTVGLSYEQAGRLDSADVLFMTFAGDADRGTFESNALVRSLPVVSGGRYFPVTPDTAVALQAPNVVAVPWLLQQLRPALERVGR